MVLAKEKQLKANLEAEDLMSAACFAPTIGVDANHSDTKGIELERVKVDGVVATAMQQIVEEAKVIAATFADANRKIGEQSCEGNREVCAELRATFLVSKDVAVEYSKALGKHLEELRGQFSALTTTAAVRAIRAEVTATMKKRSMDAAKTFAAAAKNITTWAEKDKRERAEGEQASAVAGPASSPLCQALLAVVEACDSGALNLGSVFEAKAGIRPSLIIPSGDTDPVVAIQKLPFAKQSTKAVAVYLQKEQWGVVPVAAPNAKRLGKLLAKSYDAVMRSSLPLPAHIEWSHKIYPRQFVGLRLGFCNIVFSHSCCM